MSQISSSSTLAAGRHSGLQVAVAKRLMKLRPGRPGADDFSLNEIFRHPRFLNAGDEERRSMRLASAQHRYDDEQEKPFFDLYFPDYDCEKHLSGRTVLDLGCFTGGRAVRWAKRYGIKKVLGTDINPVYMEAAREYAALKGADSEFRILDLATGARIPFADDSVDTVVSFDVFEHVDDLKRTLTECKRVLVPGGVVFVVFPSFYNPLESHLNLATRVPGLQWLFSPKALTQAYCEVIEERGEEASWYSRRGDASWEKLPTLNGTTPRAFRTLLKQVGLECVSEPRRPILVTGRRFASLRRFAVKPLLDLLLAMRVFDALLLDRITMVVRKPHPEATMK